MEIRLLGPVELRVRDRPVGAGPLRQQAVLAALAADAGRPVMVSTLVDRVWDEAPPAGSRPALYSYVSRLRRLLGPVGERDQPGGSPIGLRHRAGGYVLEADPDWVDLHRFRRLVGVAGESGCSDSDRAGLLHEALCLWQGTPLAGLPGDWAARMRTGWLQERLDAAVEWAGAELRLGRPEEIIGPVRELLEEFPLGEPLVDVLMRALVGAGRDAEALDYYAAVRARLAEELGVEPSAQLREVHQAILRGELNQPRPGRRSVVAPAAAAVVAEAEGAVPAVVAPAQLPADVAAFTGRAAELSELDSLLAGESSSESTGLAIGVVTGSGGVGKTALAVRWAHRVRGAFGDGQLYVNLRGYDHKQPVAPDEVLARFLHALGVGGSEVPFDEDERSARYRTAIGGRRMLILLDNASSAEQVRPLLPGTSTCVVVVTSRDSLSGLVCLEGARRLDLGRLPTTDAVALLHRLLGARVDAEAAAALALTGQCARLPLALRVAADLAADRSTMPLAELVTELDDQRRRLDLLDAGGDSRAAVRAVFSWSYHHLSPDAARAFRLVGLQPGPDLDGYAAAALLQTDLADGRRLLDTLARAHLAEPTAAGRCSIHDLLRAYATELAEVREPDAGRQAALTRLFDYYLATAAAAMDVVFPEPHGRPQIAPPSTPVPPLPDRTAALAWLDGERQTLAAVCAYTAAYGWPTHAVQLSRTLFRYHENGGHYTDMLAAHGHALAAARQVGDRAAEAHALSGLGIAHYRLSGYHEATAHLEQALAIFRDIGDRYGQARALTVLGSICRRLGTYEPATGHYQQAAVLFREIGDRVGEAYTLGNLGLVYSEQGRDELATEQHQWALALFREFGHPLGEGHALGSLGQVYARLGRYQPAADHQQQALALFRQLGNRGGEAEALTDLGDINTRLGRHELAASHHQQAYALYQRIGSRYGQARALNGLGEARWAGGRASDALPHHTAALDIAAETGDRDEQVRAHSGLARAHHRAGDRDRACDHWRAALAACADPGSPQATEIRDWLAALGQS